MIEIINLKKSFNGRRVLDGVNLTVNKGETKVIIGRSGCGKSVLLKHIVGILKPDEGKIIIDGTDITQLKEKQLNEVRKRIAMVFQGGALFDSLTICDNVGFGLYEHTRLDEKIIHEKIEECLRLVELGGIQYMMPSELSGGMRKRVSLARALCISPQLILYDEPTTGVDPITAAAINEVIRNLRDRLRVTSIVVTHDMKSAYRVADSVAMLYKGQIIAEGTPEEIQNTSHPVVQQFITGASTGPITEAVEEFR